MPKLVKGRKMLETLFEANSRPSERWLANQTKARRIPFIKVGRSVWFNPEQVAKALAENFTIGGPRR